MKKKHWTMIVPGAVLLCATPAFGVELRDAVQAALSTNPEIRQAVANRLATQEERVQATGLYYPRVSVEGSAGVRSLRNPTRRAIGLADQTLWPIEGDLIVDQLVYDSGGREAEIRRQASRTDAAAARVEERSEFVALNVSRTYIDYLLQQRLVAIAQDNVDLPRTARRRSSRRRLQGLDQHRRPAAGRRAAAGGAGPRDRSARGPRHRRHHLPHADRHSGRQRVDAAGPVAMHAGDARGSRSGGAAKQSAGAGSDRRSVDGARGHPRSRAELGPRFNLEGRARAGHDIDGFAGRTTDLQALGVLRWDLYNGGIKEANVREQQHRADEVHGRLFELTRAAEEDTRTAWSRLTNQTALVSELEIAGKDRRRRAAVLS